MGSTRSRSGERAEREDVPQVDRLDVVAGQVDLEREARHRPIGPQRHLGEGRRGVQVADREERRRAGERVVEVDLEVGDEEGCRRHDIGVAGAGRGGGGEEDGRNEGGGGDAGGAPHRRPPCSDGVTLAFARSLWRGRRWIPTRRGLGRDAAGDEAESGAAPRSGGPECRPEEGFERPQAPGWCRRVEHARSGRQCSAPPAVVRRRRHHVTAAGAVAPWRPARRPPSADVERCRGASRWARRRRSLTRG